MEKKSVQVREGLIREKPSFLGKKVADIFYGEMLEVLEESDGWSKVKMPGNGPSGWVHTSSLTEEEIVLSAGQENVSHSATGDELALAGKGFNQQVENEYRSRNPKVDFVWIDKMEKIRVSPEQMQVFLDEGQVTPKGGDA